MATLGERVKFALDHYGRGEYLLALEHACNAVDVTSQKYYGASKSQRSLFKDIVKEYHWLLEAMALGGVNLDETIFENFPITEGLKSPILKPTFGDLMYHVVRCSLVHSDRLTSGFSFQEGNHFILGKNHLTLPTLTALGMIAIVIFCPVNAQESIDRNYWIGMFGNQMIVNDFWGKEDVARHIASKNAGPRVTLLNLAFK